MVVIDSSSIITNLDKLLESKFEFCYSVDDEILRLPENNPLRRVLEKNKGCVGDLSVGVEPIDLTNRAFFMDPPFIHSMLAVCIKEKADAIYWASEPVFLDNPMVFYYRVGLAESQIKSINLHSSTRFENGLYYYLWNFVLIALERNNLNLQMFGDLQIFIETFSVFGAITISSLRMSFFILLFCQILVLSLFLCSKALAFLRRRSIWLLFRLSLIGNCRSMFRSPRMIVAPSIQKIRTALNKLFSTARRS